MSSIRIADRTVFWHFYLLSTLISNISYSQTFSSLRHYVSSKTRPSIIILRHSVIFFAGWRNRGRNSDIRIRPGASTTWQRPFQDHPTMDLKVLAYLISKLSNVCNCDEGRLKRDMDMYACERIFDVCPKKKSIRGVLGQNSRSVVTRAAKKRLLRVNSSNILPNNIKISTLSQSLPTSLFWKLHIVIFYYAIPQQPQCTRGP